MNNTKLAFLALIGVSGCSPSNDDTAGLIAAGDPKACATNEAKRLLRKTLMTYVTRKSGKIIDADGQDISGLQLEFDPIIGEAGNENNIGCQASAYLSIDGESPYASNTINVSYDLSTNLNKPDEIIISGYFENEREMVRTLLRNVGVAESPPSYFPGD